MTRARQAVPPGRARRSTASSCTRRCRGDPASLKERRARAQVRRDRRGAHFGLGLNVRHADQQLRGTLMLPHGTGADARVAVFAEGEKAKEAQEAGADVVGARRPRREDRGGLRRLRRRDRHARPDGRRSASSAAILGPRGKMPNPKTGTVTMDVAKAVRESKAGKLEYRTDRGANVHVSIGKKSFDERQLLENYAALIDEIMRAKPAAAKGRYIRSDHPDDARWGLASTSIRLAPEASSKSWRARKRRCQLSGARRQRQPAAPQGAEVWPGRRGEVDDQPFLARDQPARRARFISEEADSMLKADKRTAVSQSSPSCLRRTTLIVADYRGLTVTRDRRAARRAARARRAFHASSRTR